MNNVQKLEKLKSVKAELLALPDFPHSDALFRIADIDEVALIGAREKDAQHRALVREKLAKVNAAIDFVEQQINLDYCLAL